MVAFKMLRKEHDYNSNSIERTQALHGKLRKMRKRDYGGPLALALVC